MAEKILLITDFFPKCHSSTTFHTSLPQKVTQVPKVEEITADPSNASTTIGDDPLLLNCKAEATQADGDPILPSARTTAKPSFPARVKFVRHQSAPLHHRSPVKSRERPMEEQELNEMRAQIRAFRSDLYKYKAAYSRSPSKRWPHAGDPPTSPFKSPARQTPVKSFPSTMPAYERFSPLMKTIDLPLPDRYQWLFDQYKHLDFLVCHTHNSRGISTFEKVQPVIQQKTKRNFTLETLARLKTISPSMYTFQQEKIQLPTLSPIKLNYELTITPTDFGIQSDMQISASVIVERIDCFRRALFHRVKMHHREFLARKLQLSVEELPTDDDLARWHPEFDLNSLPDIEASPLPISPDDQFKKLSASPMEIRHYAERSPSQRVKRALFATFSSDDITSTITLPSPSKESLSINGISSTLIEKIRSKETNQLLSASLDEEKLMLSRLEQTIGIVQQFFIAERATTLEFDLVAKQVRDCHTGPLSYSQSTETLDYLQKFSGNDGWFSTVHIRGRQFIKINRYKSINPIIDTIKQKLSK